MSHSSKLAIEGGTPVRSTLLPYGRQDVTADDVAAVTQVLQSHWLTTGPTVDQFEQAICRTTGAKFGVAVNSGTAALHAALYALGIGAGDEVLVPTMSFAASANAAVYLGAKPVFVDVDSQTLLIDPSELGKKITSKTKAIVAVDYAGQPCDYLSLRTICQRHGLKLVADACHSLGAAQAGVPVGTLADATVFSFHPVKHVTTGEGGMVVTSDEGTARLARRLRNHGIDTDHRTREKQGTWVYDMVELGFNYRLSDINCALGLSQLPRLEAWIHRRNHLVQRYRAALEEIEGVSTLMHLPQNHHAYHLFVIRLEAAHFRAGRAEFFAALRAEGIGCNVHYRPIHLHPYYRKNFGTAEGLCPRAEAAYEQILTLPLFPAMSDKDAEDVLAALVKVADAFRR